MDFLIDFRLGVTPSFYRVGREFRLLHQVDYMEDLSARDQTQAFPHAFDQSFLWLTQYGFNRKNKKKFFIYIGKGE